MSLASLSGHAVTRAVVPVPACGVPWADVELVDPVELSGQVSLALADAVIALTVVSGGPVNGRAAYRLVGGRGKWGQEISPKAYQDDGGVKVSTIARDVADLVGESIASYPSTRVGPHFARSAGPASRVMHELAPRAWHVGLDGVTRFGIRTPTQYTGTDTRTRFDPAVGVVEIATESIAALVPGVRVDGAEPATDVEYVLDDKRLTVRVYSGPRPSRRLDAFRRIYDAIDPRRPYRSVYEYRVVTQSGERLNLQPVRAASGMPDLARVPVRPGMAGMRATVALGSLVLVAFADADPSRPQVISHDAVDSPGWMPLTLDFGEAPRLGVARLTDAVQAGPFAGVITLASTRVRAGL